MRLGQKGRGSVCVYLANWGAKRVHTWPHCVRGALKQKLLASLKKNSHDDEKGENSEDRNAPSGGQDLFFSFAKMPSS